MGISSTKEKDIICVSLSGRLDSHCVEITDKQFKKWLKDGETKFIVDFEGIEYISSAGLRIFVNATKKLLGKGGGIVLYNLSRDLINIFEITGLVNIISVADNKAEALKYFANG